MRIFIVSIILSTFFTACEQKLDVQGDKDAILDVMAKQEKAWNQGDLESFMQGYWHSEELSFVGKKGVTKGWQATLDNYKKGYPDKAAMGQLSFDILSLEMLNNNTYHMIGKYTLIVGEDTPSGHFTLVWKKINSEWLITIDHSS